MGFDLILGYVNKFKIEKTKPQWQWKNDNGQWSKINRGTQLKEF